MQQYTILIWIVTKHKKFTGFNTPDFDEKLLTEIFNN